ncbi:MAG: 50S ribosomal protein L13 [Parcubacteria group bacterium]
MKNTKAKNKQQSEEGNWYLIDAKQASLGRIATKISGYLTGKNRPDYSPHEDKGGYVVVINTDKLNISAKKSTNKMYHHYSGYPGGLKSKSLAEKLEQRGSAWVVREAVRGMLPKNRLRKGRLARLKVYGGAEHPHQDKIKK